MMHHAMVSLYRIWHGVFRFKGAGKLLTKSASSLRGLQHYELKLPEDQVIEVDFRDVSSMYWLNHLLGDPFEERALLAAIKPFLKGDDVIWDIGANSGLLSYHLAKCGNPRELHLFEPNPRMSKLASAALSPYEHAMVHDYGLSDRNAEFVLTIPQGHTPACVGDLSHFHLEDIARSDAMQQRRRIFSLDDVLHQRGDIDQRGRIANGPILAVEHMLVRADDKVARPLAPVLRLA